jgi:FkbM family methyltransferase
MRRKLQTKIRDLLPMKYRMPIRYGFNWLRGTLDPELLILGTRILPITKRAVDIGANFGTYTYRMTRYARNVECFEPIIECADFIRAWGSSKVQVHQVALADQKGLSTLKIPKTEFGFASAIASLSAPNGEYKEVEVELRTLDEYAFVDVELIKIDVEGYEMEVLEGSLNTLRLCRPNLIIEIEEWHLQRRGKTVQEVFKYLESLEYSAYFLKNGKLLSILEFDLYRDQTSLHGTGNTKQYINNFIFLPREKANR